MRVVAGRLGGRRLHTARGAATRPTTERARAGLFDWIGAQIEGATVLDLFAGSGALGIEALSRGARAVTFVELGRAALAALRRNLEELDVARQGRVLPRDAFAALRVLVGEGESFDWIFADPPYGHGLPERLLASPPLTAGLAAQGNLLIERAARERSAPDAEPLALLGTRVHGGIAFDWYRRKEDPSR